MPAPKSPQEVVPSQNSLGPRTDEVAVSEKKSQRAKQPRMFKVIILNDDYTPMEFVVDLLQSLFQMNIETATRVMLSIHHEGRGVCGIYTRDVAATKIDLVGEAARRAGHPLQSTMEAA